MKPFTTPLDGAFWINDFSIGGSIRDCRVQLLRKFELKTVPEKCEVKVTADSRYTLWVNGEFVNHGPARGFAESQPFDRLDIAPYLVSGSNTLALLLYRPGGSHYSYIYAGIHGIILQGSCDGVDISTGKEWLLRCAPGYLPGVARAAGQYSWQEYFDCTKDDWSWITPAYEVDASWRIPEDEECRIPGSPPWDDFEERGIPLLTNFIRQGELVNCGVLKSSAPCELATPLRDSFPQDVIDWNGDKSGAVKVIRFEGEFFGFLEFSITAAEEALIDYIAFEAFKDDGTPAISTGTLYGGRLKVGKGRNFHQLTLPWGSKAVLIIDRSAHPEANQITVNVRETVYPLDIQGGFSSNDEQLNRIWDISLATQKHCMCDAYVDGPWRECAQWWGDALVQVRNTFILSDDDLLLRRGIKQFAMQKAPAGLIYGVTPAQAPRCVLPDYAAIYLSSCYYLYRQNGTVDIFHQVYDRLQSIVKYFDEMSEDNGLLPLDMRFWMFVDWCPTLDKLEAYNLIVVYSLDQMAELAAVAGDEQFSAKCRMVADRISSHITFENPSPHAAAMAILCGRFADKEEKFKNEILLPLLKSNRDFDRMPSPYFMFFVFEAAKKLRCNAEVLDCIRRWWQTFIDADIGTTPEKWLECCTPGTSRCHAWSAHPMVHMSEILLGIRQNEVAWGSVIFDPLLVPKLHCSGRIPTPHGVIEVAIDTDKNIFSVKAPAAVKVIDAQGLLK